MYDMVEQLTAGLEWAETRGRAELLAEGDPVAGFRVVDGVVVSELVLPGGKAIDVSRQPAAIELHLQAVARKRRFQPDGWTASVTARFARWTQSADIGVVGGQPPTLVGLLIEAGFPILREAGANGLEVPRELPVWAAPAMRQLRPRDGLSVAMGRRPSRSLVRAFAGSLRDGPGRFSLSPLALVVAADGLGDDRLVRVIAAGPGADPGPGCGDRDAIDAVALCFGRMDPQSGERLATEALGTEGGMVRLVQAARILREVRHYFDDLPNSLDELERFVLALVPITPARPQSEPVRSEQHAIEERAERPLPATPLAPRQTTTQTDGISSRFSYDRDLGRLHHHAFGAFRFVLPLRPDDLRTWGTVLQNCLASFVPVVSDGRSIIVGIEQRDVIVAALELDRESGSVRQFLGERNRRPPRRLDELVQRELRALVRPQPAHGATTRHPTAQ